MDQLPAALQPLAAYRQFIVWQEMPGSPKPRKVPINVHTLQPADPHDARHWLKCDEAIRMAQLLGDRFAVGFVLTGGDPFWFIDIDHCLDGNQWSDQALTLLRQFEGAAVEVSHSGDGLHIIGSGTAPTHSSRNTAQGLEFYTEKRFVALTGDQASGNAAFDASHLLPRLVAEYFPPHVAGPSDCPVEWTEGPVAGWNGPDDDDLLVQKACGSLSASQAWTGKATFADLWTANTGALAATYPSTDPEQPYGASEADAALAQHLAFWTGKDCARTERLMRRSALKREKWDRRENGPGYLRRTILRAVANQTDVYGQNRTAPPATATPDGPPPPPRSTSDVLYRSGYQYMPVHQQGEYFGAAVYVRDLHRAWTPDGALLKPEQFNATYGGYVFGLDSQNEKTTRKAWEVFTESQGATFRRAHGTCFRPELPTGTLVSEEGRTLLNTYVPLVTPQADGDPGRYLELLQKMLPDERDRTILLSYMAAMLQYPGVKFQWCPLIQGMEGNGKTLIVSALAHAVGHRYTHLPNAKELGNNGTKFTAWIRDKLFIGIEEIYVSERREVTESLKPLITNSRIEIQGKGQDQVTGDNRANFIMCTNHKDALKVDFDSRRYAILYCAQQSLPDLQRDGMTGNYFPDLYNWMRAEGYAIVNRWLRQYPIPDELNPATQCQRAPLTSSTQEAVSLSMGAIEQEIMEAISEGVPGFAEGWVSSMALDKLLDKLRASGKIPRNRRRGLMQRLGYDWHPALESSGGRVNNPIIQEGGKPKLFSRVGHIHNNVMSPAEVTRLYMKAQGYLTVDQSVNAEVESGSP